MRATGNPLDEARRAAVRQALGTLCGVVPVGILATDPDGVVWYHSQRWDDLLGVAAAAALTGRPWCDAVHPGDRDAVVTRWAARAEHRGRLGRFRVRCTDGSERMCDGEGVAMVAADGSLEGYLVVATDAERPLGDRDAAAGGAALATPHLLDAILDRSPDIITILNADGSWRWSSGGAIRLIGHQESFDAAEGIYALLHPTDRDTARRMVARAVAGEAPAEDPVIVRLRSADGSWRTMEPIFHVLLDEPAVAGIVVHLRDVTNSQRMLEELESSNRRLASLIAGMPTAGILIDEHSRVVIANQAFTDLFRLPYGPGELQGHTLQSLGITPRTIVADPPDADCLLGEMQRGSRHETTRFVLFDGRIIECDVVPVDVQGVNRGHMSTFRDVTNQARAEAERDRLLASEQEENRRLAELDAYRSESIATVSHELRTPLTSIVGYSQLLRSMLDPATSPDEVACLDAIVRNVDRLLRLAGDVVALDSLESRALPLPVTEVHLPRVVQRAVRTIAPAAAAKDITLTVHSAPGAPLRADADRLGQLLENLLSNAVKFTLPGGRVTVRACPSGAGWELTVADSGIGIPEDELSMLSTRFFRASNARRRGFPGSGLGLSVARAIAERHGGSLAVESVVGVGTTVRVRLADADSAAGSGSDAAADSGSDAPADSASDAAAHGDVDAHAGAAART